MMPAETPAALLLCGACYGGGQVFTLRKVRQADGRATYMMLPSVCLTCMGKGTI